MSIMQNEEIFLKRKRIEKVKAQELLELQQEEEYLRHIRREKEQVELIAEEFQGHQGLISDLKQQIERANKYKLYYEKYETIKDLLEATISKLEAKEAENEELKLDNRRWQMRVDESDRERKITQQLEDEVDTLRKELIELKKQGQSNLALEPKKAEERQIFVEKELKNEQDARFKLERDLFAAEEKSFYHQNKLNETLKELEQEKTINARLQLDSQECLEIRQQLAAQASVLKKQEILFEELRTSKIEDDRRISQLQDEINLRDQELLRGKQVTQKLIKEFDLGQMYIIELESRLALIQKESQELRKNNQQLLDKLKQEKFYRQEKSQANSEFQEIRNQEVNKINQIFDRIIQSKQQF